jgi:hypothetical protein
MTNRQDANSKAEAGESLKDVAENTISSTSEKDALGDRSMDDVSGGSWPYNNLARASYISSGSGG